MMRIRVKHSLLYLEGIQRPRGIVLQSLGTLEDIERDNDVIELLKAIKQQVFDANERKHASLWMVMTWKKLMGCRQNNNEDLIDYYKRFVGMIEMVELSFGNIKPKDDDDKERSKFIAMMFIHRVDWKQYGYLLKNMETDYLLGNTNVYPDGIESGLQVLILYSEKQLKQKKHTEKQMERPIVSMDCWECGSKDYMHQGCEIWKAKIKAKEAWKKCQAISNVHVAEPLVPQWMA